MDFYFKYIRKITNKMEKLKIYNGFGIVPTKNYIAAGYDFYLPLITDESLFDMVVSAFAKSYKKTTKEIIEIMDEMNLYLSSIYDNREFTKCDLLNITHLFLGLTPPDDTDWVEEPEEMSLDEAIDEFVTYRLLFDSKGDTLVPGIAVTEGDYLLFNSGIKVNLPKDTAGIFFNKSGMGNKGYDTRACVVDEDYSGFVHLSVAFTKSLYFREKLFCGDKIQQMVVLPLVKTEIEEVEENVYTELMSDSQRGSDGFGSSDVKH